ncbi:MULTISPECIES: hypothetical protein [Streptomyces]|uniref:Uncharacterized protein n=2 Tax=Streptomyces TaxID=1883 RepID=A0A0W7X471_9ACTN|nr:MULTISPECIES: hypothetical protein [Streptomyces]KUF17701.1 hypothetical protein AT728_09880 [Streptomyces silvensis]MVO83683.1 hypothetical protein [Streptomyces typhae]
MPASERDAQPQPFARPEAPSAWSMSDLLASCAAASAVSTPPAAPPHHPVADTVDERRRDAA